MKGEKSVIVFLCLTLCYTLYICRVYFINFIMLINLYFRIPFSILFQVKAIQMKNLYNILKRKFAAVNIMAAFRQWKTNASAPSRFQFAVTFLPHPEGLPCEAHHQLCNWESSEMQKQSLHAGNGFQQTSLQLRPSGFYLSCWKYMVL